MDGMIDMGISGMGCVFLFIYGAPQPVPGSR
jgi:hypothetical protein